MRSLPLSSIMESNSNQAEAGQRGRRAQHQLNIPPERLFCFTEHCSVFMASFVLFMDSIRTKGRLFCFIYFVCVYEGGLPCLHPSFQDQQFKTPQHRNKIVITVCKYTFSVLFGIACMSPNNNRCFWN